MTFRNAAAALCFAGLAMPAAAQDITLTLKELEYSDFFESCYADWGASVEPEGSVTEFKFQSITVFGGVFGAAGVRSCDQTLKFDGSSSNSCSVDEGEDNFTCDKIESIAVSDFTCDGEPCAGVTVTENELIKTE